jgi:hypothetical protein
VVRLDDAQLYYLRLGANGLEVLAATSGWGSASAWAALTAADLVRDGTDELFAARDFDGLLFRTASSGISGPLEVLAPVGASKSWGGLATFDVTGLHGPMPAGCSNRTGNIYVYGAGLRRP